MIAVVARAARFVEPSPAGTADEGPQTAATMAPKAAKAAVKKVALKKVNAKKANAKKVAVKKVNAKVVKANAKKVAAKKAAASKVVKKAAAKKVEKKGAKQAPMVEVKKWSVRNTDKEGWNSKLVGLSWTASAPGETGKVEERWLWTPPNDKARDDSN